MHIGWHHLLKPHAVTYGFRFCILFGFGKDGKGLVDEVIGVGASTMIDARLTLEVSPLANQSIHEREILLHPWSSLAIIGLDELVDNGLGIRIRIPHQFGKQIGLQFGKISTRNIVRPLLHHADGLVVAERLQIALEHRDVGEWQEILLEGGHIIPDIEMRRNAAPCLHVFEERCILSTTTDGMREAAFDAAKAYHHILTRLDALWCLARVLVGKSTDILVGEILLDGGCHLIDEPKHCA